MFYKNQIGIKIIHVFNLCIFQLIFMIILIVFQLIQKMTIKMNNYWKIIQACFPVPKLIRFLSNILLQYIVGFLLKTH